MTHTSRPSRMSKDRVHFTVPARYLEKKNYRDLIQETMGISECAYPKTADLHIICRPSQFARFVILRFNKYGEQNSMSCLNSKLVSPEPTKAFIDCSDNPNTAVGETE